jgi:hypothetical protein
MHLRLAVALLVAAAVLAGCVASKAPDAAPSPTPTVSPRDLPRPTLQTPVPRTPIKLGTPGAAEPNLAVAPDGTFYASNPCTIWRSDDDGKSWKETAHRGQDGCGDGDIAVDGKGNLYWLGLFGKAGPVPFEVSTDKGESFGAGFDVSEKTGADREWIDATPDGRIFTTWRGNDLEFRSSIDGGATWLKKSKVGPDGDEGPVSHDAATGELYIPVVDSASTVGLTPSTVRVHTSTDGGATWANNHVTTMPRSTPVEPNGYASDFPVVAVDDNGTAYLVWSGDASAYAEGVTPPEELAIYGIYLATSVDHGAHWSEPRLVSDPAHGARFPWVVAGLPGRVAITWYESVRRNPGETVPDEWNVKLWESVTADKTAPQSVTVTLTPTPNHVGSLCTSGTGCVAGGDRSLLDYFEMAIAPDGQPIVVWSASVLGTGVGKAVQGTDVIFGGIATGTPLR